MDAATLAAVWPIESLTEPEPLPGGINNRSFRVRTASGDYILRIYPHTTPPEQIAFEMSLLSALARVTLPFQTPVPVPARTGELAPLVPSEDRPVQAILTPMIPGTFRRPSSPVQAYSAGAALGALTVAMASLSLPKAPRGNYGDLERLLPDPLEAANLPYVDADTRKRLTRLLAEVMAERHAWYNILPCQVIHGDYVPFNLLMVGERVSAVLDFELAHGRGLRPGLHGLSAFDGGRGRGSPVSASPSPGHDAGVVGRPVPPGYYGRKRDEVDGRFGPGT